MANFARPAFIHIPAGALSRRGYDRIQRAAWNDVQRTELTRVYGPAADPLSSEWINDLLFNNTFKILYGRVVDSFSYVNMYRVLPEKSRSVLLCTQLVQTGLNPMGAVQVGQIPIGSKVVFLEHTSSTIGYIIGVMPWMQTASQYAMPDFISQQGRSGLLVEPGMKVPFSFDSSALLQDFSSGRPLDATTDSNFGAITETGLLNFVDSYMNLNRVDEETGVWSFYHDQLTRVAGHNLQVWTAGHEREAFDDEGEYNDIKGYTPYYWEALGAFSFGVNVTRDLTPNEWQQDPSGQAYSALEPCNDHQTSWLRLRDIFGYLGQAHKRILSLPPQCAIPAPPAPTGAFDDGTTCNDQDINILQVPTIFPGVYEEDLALTGRKVIRTAHEYIISKYLPIPTPKRVLLAEDLNGDNSSNYMAAGNQGDGPFPQITGDVKNPGVDNSCLVRAAGFMDTHAFAFNWVGDHPFYYHTLDWYLPEESALAYLPPCEAPSFPPPIFAQLACHQYLEEPVPIALYVDHRYGDVNYYPNNSYFALLNDGGSVWGDGFGSEIRMTAGCIWLTCPGDLYIETGKDFVVFSGYDICARAKNCIDLSATNKDVRIKAKERLWMVASGECGGILLESMATAAYCDFETDPQNPVLGGITIKGEQTLLTFCGQSMSFNLTNSADDTNTEDNIIQFDCGWGGRFRVKAQYIENFLSDDGAKLNWWVTPAAVTDPTYTITVTVTDADSGITTASAPIQVFNRRQGVSLAVLIMGTTIYQSGETSITGTIIDPDNVCHKITIDWGDSYSGLDYDEIITAGATTFHAAHFYLDYIPNASPTIVINLYSESGDLMLTQGITIMHIGPSNLIIFVRSSVEENQTVPLSGQFVDQGHLTHTLSTLIGETVIQTASISVAAIKDFQRRTYMQHDSRLLMKSSALAMSGRT